MISNLQSYACQLCKFTPTLLPVMDPEAFNKYFPLFLFGGIVGAVLIARIAKALGFFAGFERSNILEPPPGLQVKGKSGGNPIKTE